MALDTEVAQRALQLCHELDKEGVGALDPAKLQAILKEVSPESNDEELAALVRSVDINEDGVVQYQEFLRWLRFPPTESGVSLSFEESLRSGMLDRIKLDDKEELASKDVPASSPSVGPSKGEGAVKPSTEEEDDILMDAFVHPLLERFSICKDEPPAPGVLNIRLDTSARREGGSVTRVAGQLEVTPAEVNQAESLPELLVALSQAYKAMLDAFLESSDAHKGLRLPLLPVKPKTRMGASSSIRRAQQPTPFWSAVSLALAQLSCRQLAALKEQCVEVQAGAAGALFQEVLATKVANAKVLAIDAQRGRLPMRKDGYGWCRRDNDGDARLWRFEAFLLSQRAVYSRGFTVQPAKEIKFANFHSMLCGTKVFTPEIAANAGNTDGAAEPSVTFEVLTIQDVQVLNESIGETVMEVATHFMKEGCRVAAVNAASAYQVGGGASTGGRHALEEAWCISSSLYPSLASVEPLKTGGLPGYRQHIPVMGCIVSPDVEVFREPTDDGYGFLDDVQRLTGVVSVAMFNRNRRVRDSPLDSPDQPAEYLKQTRAKLEAALLAAVEVLNAEVVIVPDVGCGVFGNDPYIIGGCLGSVLRRHSANLQSVKKVVITGRRADFSDACLRALKGEDPRPACASGAACNLRATDSMHEARYSHGAPAEGDAGGDSIVDEGLLQLAKHPPEVDEKRKNPCKYGASCRIRTADHFARYSHPEADSSRGTARGAGPATPGTRGVGPVGPSSGASGAAGTRAVTGPGAGTRGIGGGGSTSGSSALATPGAKVAPTRPRSAHDKPADPSTSLAEPASDVRRAETPTPEPNPVVTGGSTSSRGRPICRYGEACYNQNPKHLADFSHPWLEGEDDSEAQSRRDQQDCHDLLNKAKAGKWEDVQAGVIRNPRLLDMRPDSRKFGLIHYAAFQFHVGGLDMLLKHGADPNLKNQDGRTALELLRAEMKAIPSTDLKHRRMAEDCLLRLRRYDSREPAAGASGAVAGAAVGASAGRLPPSLDGGGSGGRGAVPCTTTSSRDPAVAGISAPGADSGSRPSKVCRTYILVSGSPAVDLNGEYQLLDEKANGRDVYRKVTPTVRGNLLMYYHKNPKTGWSIGYDSSSEEVLAFMGPSTASDPSAKAYLQYWEVLMSYTLGGGTRSYFAPTTRMALSKYQRTESGGR